MIGSLSSVECLSVAAFDEYMTGVTFYVGTSENILMSDIVIF